MKEKNFKKKYDSISELYCEILNQIEKLKKDSYFKENKVPFCHYLNDCVDYTTLSLGAFTQYFQEMDKYVKRTIELGLDKLNIEEKPNE